MRNRAGYLPARLDQALVNLEGVLRRARLTLADVVRLSYHTTDGDGFIRASEALGPRLVAAGCRCASTLLGVTRLAFHELLVGIEATAAALRPEIAPPGRRRRV